MSSDLTSSVNASNADDKPRFSGSLYIQCQFGDIYYVGAAEDLTGNPIKTGDNLRILCLDLKTQERGVSSRDDLHSHCSSLGPQTFVIDGSDNGLTIYSPMVKLYLAPRVCKQHSSLHTGNLTHIEL